MPHHPGRAAGSRSALVRTCCTTFQTPCSKRIWSPDAQCPDTCRPLEQVTGMRVHSTFSMSPGLPGHSKTAGLPPPAPFVSPSNAQRSAAPGASSGGTRPGGCAAACITQCPRLVRCAFIFHSQARFQCSAYELQYEHEARSGCLHSVMGICEHMTHPRTMPLMVCQGYADGGEEGRAAQHDARVLCAAGRGWGAARGAGGPRPRAPAGAAAPRW